MKMYMLCKMLGGMPSNILAEENGFISSIEADELNANKDYIRFSRMTREEMYDADLDDNDHYIDLISF